MPFLGLEPSTDCLVPLIDAIEAQAKGDLADIDGTAMRWRPPAGGWSVAEVLEHLVISNTLYFGPVRSLIAEAERTDGAVPPWKPSFMGGLLIRSLVPTAQRKVPTVKKLQPGPDIGPDVATRFLGTMRELTDLLWSAQGIDMRKPRMTSPVSPLVRRLNLGDAFVISVVHCQRHMLQIERVLAGRGFPAHG